MTDPHFTPWPAARTAQYRQAGYWRDETLPEMLQASATRYPAQLALICGERQWSYAALLEQVNQLAAGFQQQGLSCGDRVVLHLPNTAESYFSFFALLSLGVQPVLALPAHRYSELSYFCEFVDAKAYIGANQPGFDAVTTAQQLAAACPGLQQLLIHTDAPHPLPAGITTLASLFIRNELLLPLQQPPFAFFQLSGGTTGRPKLIPRTHADYLYSVRASNQVCAIGPQDRYLCVLPAAHNFPLSSPGALGMFVAGACVVLSQDPSPQHCFALIEQHHITVAALVPPLALLWLDHAQKQGAQLPTLRLVQIGGAKLCPDTAARITPILGCQLQQVFGMAEGLVNYTRLDDNEAVICHTQGRPMSDADELRIVDDQDQPLAQGEVGHLQVRGPYTICGYYAAPEHNAHAFTEDGFYRTGDLVRLTDEGNLQVMGRSKDQINRGGEKIAAVEIENQLRSHPLVHDAAVFAISDPYLGERSCAVLVSPEQQPKVIELKRYLRAQGLADFKIPDRIEWVDALPKTPVGKIDKKRLQQAFEPQSSPALA